MQRCASNLFERGQGGTVPCMTMMMISWSHEDASPFIGVIKQPMIWMPCCFHCCTEFQFKVQCPVRTPLSQLYFCRDILVSFCFPSYMYRQRVSGKRTYRVWVRMILDLQGSKGKVTPAIQHGLGQGPGVREGVILLHPVKIGRSRVTTCSIDVSTHDGHSKTCQVWFGRERDPV